MNTPAPRSLVPEPITSPQRAPDADHVHAAVHRRRIPFWAMGTLALMPVWGFAYVRALTESTEVADGPLSAGADSYHHCASCHGATGEGANGYQLSNGHVLETFPRIEDQIRYVFYGTERYAAAEIEIYGDPNRPGGPHITGATGSVMPAFGPQLSQAEIISVVCHERYTLGGADPTDERYATEYETWCSDQAPVFDAVQSGGYDLTSSTVDPFEADEVIPIGPVPLPGSTR